VRQGVNKPQKEVAKMKRLLLIAAILLLAGRRSGGGNSKGDDGADTKVAVKLINQNSDLGPCRLLEAHSRMLVGSLEASGAERLDIFMSKDFCWQGMEPFSLGFYGYPFD
jgi:hypothetical protein